MLTGDEIIEIQELPALAAAAADVDQEETIQTGESAPIHQEASERQKFSAESMATMFTNSMFLVSQVATRATNRDMTLIEEEAQQLHKAAYDWALTFEGVEMPPWAVLAFTCATITGSKIAFAPELEKPSEENSEQNPQNSANVVELDEIGGGVTHL